MPGSFQTHFPVLRPINQGYICVGWTSTPRGGGGAQTFVFCLYMHAHFVCVCVCVCVFVLPVRVCVRVSEEGVFVCFVSICRRRWEEVVDAGLIPALQSKLQSQTSFSAPPSSFSSRFQRWRTSLTDLNTVKHTHEHTHTHTPFSALLGLARRRIIFQHLCSSVPVCLLPEASGTPGPELPLLLSSLLRSFFPPLLSCLAVISPVSFQVYSYE